MNTTHSTGSVQACQNCKKDFLVDADNIAFCEKINVPLPTWCPPCRMTRRLAFPNAWGVYFRDCDKCKNKTLTMYSPKNQMTVYCEPCWWADDWDGTEYGMNYDSKRPFLEQWRELQLKTPHASRDVAYLTLKNCDYSNAIAYSKNCYLTFWADYCEEVYYSSLLNELRDSADCFRMYRSELCYESVGAGRSSKLYFCDACDDSTDMYFSRNCYGCMNCVGCVNLRGASYMIFNEQYSKEGYFKKLEELKLDTRDGIKEMLLKMKEIDKKFPYREYTGNPQNFNVSGDYVFESKNAQDCYMCVSTEDSKFCQFISVGTAKDCYDYSGWGNAASQIYECAASGEGINNMKFCFGCFANGLNGEYCGWCIGVKDNFGCCNLKRKQYAILNKVYDKETYTKLVAQIKEDMIKNPYTDSVGRIYKYGEFFPPEFSSFPYSDSNGFRFIPKTKSEALVEGFNWVDKNENTYTATIKIGELPQTISDTDENILKEIIECESCSRGYKIVLGELNILKKLNMPLPSKCPKCREKRRFDNTNKPFLRETKCDKCKKEIRTAHTQESGKIIYCEKCYQGEFV